MMDRGGSGPAEAPGTGPAPPTSASLRQEAYRLARQAWHSLSSQPAWLLVAVTAALALPKAVRLWSSDAIFSLGFLLVPWAVGWIATRPTQPSSTPLLVRVGLLALTVAFTLVGWFYGVTWAAVWALAGALALVVAEQGPMPRGLVPASLVVLTAPPPLFDDLVLEARQAVTVASDHTLALVGIPVVRDAMTLSTDTFTFSVAPQCVGMSSLLATVALVGMVATHVRAPLGRLGLALLVGVVAALSLNLVRVVGVVASTEWIGTLLVEGAFHGGVSMAMGLAAFGLAVPTLGRDHLLGPGDEDEEGHGDIDDSEDPGQKGQGDPP